MIVGLFERIVVIVGERIERMLESINGEQAPLDWWKNVNSMVLLVLMGLSCLERHFSED